MRSHYLPKLLWLGALAITSNAPAQEAGPSDSVPFRRGQWAARHSLSYGGTTSVGVLRFSSPIRAWVLDGTVGGNRARATTHSTDSTLDGSEVESRGLGFSLRAGRRWYRPLATRVVAFRTIGISGSYGYDSRENSRGWEFTSHRWTTGGFLEFGGTWLPSPHLGLGSALSGTVGYERLESSERTTSATQFIQVQRRFTAGLSLSPLVITIFF